MAIVVGLDIGNISSKLVALDDGTILHEDILISGQAAEGCAQSLLDRFLTSKELSMDNIKSIACTGVGRDDVSFASLRKGIPLALAKGVHYLFPQAHTAIDIGGETSWVIRFDDKGRLEDYAGQDKCAAGTGVFIEAIAKVLEMSTEEISRASLAAKDRADISSTCAIFVEQEVISNIHTSPPTPISDIVAGVYTSMAARVVGMARATRIVPETVFCGGVAKNTGFTKILQEELRVKLLLSESPQIIPALGIAKIAQENL